MLKSRDFAHYAIVQESYQTGFSQLRMVVKVSCNVFRPRKTDAKRGQATKMKPKREKVRKEASISEGKM